MKWLCWFKHNYKQTYITRLPFITYECVRCGKVKVEGVRV